MSQDSAPHVSAALSALATISALACRGLRRLDWLRLRRLTGASSLMCIPVCAAGEVLGVLNLASENPLGMYK